MATIVSTYGPRGYKPKYGVTSDGTTVELYSGPLIKDTGTGGSSVPYNYDYLNLSDSDLPFYMSSLGAYKGTTDAERIAWLQDQMLKMQKVALIYLNKIKEISADEPDLAKVVSSSLVVVGGKLLVAAPPAGVLVFGVGLVIKFLSSSTAKKILEFKTKKVLEWSAIIKMLQDNYILYGNEIKGLQNKRTFTIVGVLGLLFLLIYKRRLNG